MVDLLECIFLVPAIIVIHLVFLVVRVHRHIHELVLIAV